MLVADCYCGQEVPFPIEDKASGGTTETCDSCGRELRLSVRSVSPPDNEGDSDE